MNFIELVMISLGLSTDAFVVAICAGLTMEKVTVKKTLIIGLYFGIFQAGMPVIGYILAMQFSDNVGAYSPWIAFVLLSFLGIKTIIGAFKKESRPCKICKSCGVCSSDNQSKNEEMSLSPKKMLPLAVATSIDALAVGVTFAFLYVNLAIAVSFIGVITFVVALIGVKIGNVFGIRYKTKAEIFGGIMLIGTGLYILIEHLIA